MHNCHLTEFSIFLFNIIHTTHAHTLYIHRLIAASFSLIMTYPPPRGACEIIDNSNEGILLSAVLPNFTDNIRFYYRKREPQIRSWQYPHVNFIDYSDHELLQLYYENGDNFTVPGTFNKNFGLLNYTFDMSQYMNQFVSLTWKQQVSINVNLGSDCDVWSLDNVEVTLQYENCNRKILSEDFEDVQ